MMLKAKLLMAGAALAASLAAVSPAAAKVVVYYFAGGGLDGTHDDVFSPTDQMGGLPVNKPFFETKGACGGIANSCTYDFVFKLAGLAPGDTTAIQIQAQATKLGPQALSFDVYSGSPTGAHSFLSASSALLPGTPTNPYVSLMLGDGAYYVQFVPSTIKVNGELPSGSIIETIVPEPMAWTLMLLGFGGVGAALRRRAAKPASIAA